jgi:hypothetical protein
MSTTEEAKTEGKEAGPNAPPVSIGWDSHQPVVRVCFPRWMKLLNNSKLILY